MSTFGIVFRDTGALSLPIPIIPQYVMVCIFYVRNKLRTPLNSLSLNLEPIRGDLGGLNLC